MDWPTEIPAKATANTTLATKKGNKMEKNFVNVSEKFINTKPWQLWAYRKLNAGILVAWISFHHKMLSYSVQWLGHFQKEVVFFSLGFLCFNSWITILTYSNHDSKVICNASQQPEYRARKREEFYGNHSQSSDTPFKPTLPIELPMNQRGEFRS